MKLSNQRRSTFGIDAAQDPVLDSDALREAFADFVNGNGNLDSSAADAEQLFGYAPAVWKRPVAEGFRLLALNVQQFLSRSSRRTVIIMSPFASDGRSWTAASLAKALSDLHPPVTLVDADCMGSGFGELVHPASVPPKASANDVDLYARWGFRTRTGHVDGNGRDGNGNERLRESDLKNGMPKLWLMQPDRSRISRQTDLVPTVSHILEQGDKAGLSIVVDTPACTTSSFGFSLAAAHGAGVVYVARLRAKGGVSVHREVRAQLDFLGATVIGVVLNEF